MAYPGGKGRMRQQLISMIPPHRVYIETHLGAGAVLRAKRPAEETIGIDIDPSVVAQWRSRGAEFVLVNGDATAFLGSYPFRGDEFVYCDPPYVTATRRRRGKLYRFELSDDEHHRLLGVLKALPCQVMLSGYRCPLYDRELGDWRRIDSLARTQAGVAIESVWLNYPAPLVLHDYDHLGATFREREAVKRRRAGIMKRVDALPALERNAILFDLAHRDRNAFSTIAATIRPPASRVTDEKCDDE